MYILRQMAERSVQEFRSEVSIGMDDMQPAVPSTQQEGEKTLGINAFIPNGRQHIWASCVVLFLYCVVLPCLAFLNIPWSGL